MTRILVVEHEAECPPALFGTWLEDAGAGLEVCRPWAGEELPGPAGLPAYDAVVVLGGSMGADDDELHHWIGPVKELVRSSVASGQALLGICLGHQLVASALGGTVERNPRGQQVGLYDVGWLPEAADDDLVAGLGPVRGVQWNSDVVTGLPEGAVALARTDAGELQVARFAPRAWGVQLHPEVDGPVVASWAAGDRDDHLERGIDQAAVIADIDGARAELDAAWRPLATRFAELAR
ncbi:type 1 glutamine amidotransferase [Nocardioides euryhalodurans]|uniref:Type 1 glutamine amidotransferase n=1 Tax=Nocardioides euryhalodurans TaxID=2518370 RepID=A0A4P7GI96_9ACTN|nr:type 1 glutamine amidotransferase [Nocardioides euryhalodurans]QBR91543.1 type 1 glutamine amidotransferase [Nocardioides euryhalodurans]